MKKILLRCKIFLWEGTKMCRNGGNDELYGDINNLVKL